MNDECTEARGARDPGVLRHGPSACPSLCPEAHHSQAWSPQSSRFGPSLPHAAKKPHQRLSSKRNIPPSPSLRPLPRPRTKEGCGPPH